ncbi:probable serine/threonine-protein kinase DDB_G0267514 at C-terminar half [Coccomyxa sp. Obi]|nr:probable serine/threonine-protein kinase DDB_G0267514 at C-terminar half [Coccomyxa sp. Obi]
MIVRQSRAVILLTALITTNFVLPGVHGVAGSPDRDILIQFRDNIDNWAVFKNASALNGWDDHSPVCSWGGVLCSDTQRVTHLYLGCSLCNVKAMGNIHPSLANLDQLQVLRLDRNWFNGSLPKEFAYGFPNLVELRLDFNSLTGTIPTEWGSAGAFPSLQRAHVGGNQLKGSLPDMQSGAMAELQVLGLQWNMLQGSIPSSWSNLQSMRALWVRPGNYQLCGTVPPLASFQLCKEVDTRCEITDSLGTVCSLEVPVDPGLLPPPTATATVLEAVLRMEGANIMPFTANNLNIFVSALVDSLPNMTASDVVIGQVVPVIWTEPANGTTNGRQLATPSAWPVPNLQHLPAYITGNGLVDFVGQNSVVNPDDAVILIGGRRRLQGPAPRREARGSGARRKLQQVSVGGSAAPLPPGLQGAVFRPRPGFPKSGAAAPALAVPPVEMVPATLPAAAAEPPSTVAVPFGTDRPYGTPVPGGVLIGADMSLQLKTITNGNVSEAEAMLARVASSQALVDRLRLGGLAVVHVMLVSCEPLDPSALPVRLRPQIINFTIPIPDYGVPVGASSQHFPHYLIVVIVLAVVGILSAVFTAGTLIAQRVWKQRLHPSASPTSGGLATAHSAEALKAQPSQLEVRLSSNAATSLGTPSRTLHTLASDMETSGGQLLGTSSDRSLSETGTQVSDATLVARLGNEELSGQAAERQAAGLQASTSGRTGEQDQADWAGGQRLGSIIELPALPWSDWEISAEQITICKHEDGSDWELGAGAFGKVFKALRGGVQTVAVKILHDAEVGGVNFTREIAILKGCRHSNIVQFQGACVSGNRTMLVMEYVEGGDLWRALQREGSRVRSWMQQGRRVALDIARGLCFLHAHSIVLFDLKSHNVLLTRDGTAKIADVGLAKVLTQGYVSKLEEVAGTFAWAAPELLMGGRCSDKVDMYSFGVVLWELATCERPQRGQLRDVRVPEEVPEEVAQLINECLSYDPKDRPSAKQIYDRLQATPGPAPVRLRASASEASSTGAGSSAPAGSAAAAATSAAAPPLPELGQVGSVPLPGDGSGGTAAEPPQKMPTPLGRTRLPVKSAFAIDE